MLKNKSLVIGVIGNWLAMLATVGVSIFLTPYLIRTIGDRQFGVWTLLVSIISVFGLLELGMTPAIFRFTSFYIGQKDRKNLETLLSTTMLFILSVSVTCVLLAFMTRKALADYFAVPSGLVTDFSQTILIMGFATGCSFFANTFLCLLRANEYFIPGNIVKFAMEILRGTLSIIAVHRGWGIRGLAVVTLAVAALTLVSNFTFYRLLIKGIDFKISEARFTMLRRLFLFGLPTALIVISELLRTRLDSIIIGKYLTLQDITRYSIGARLVTFLLEFMVAMTAVLDPRFARMKGAGDDEGIRRLFLHGSVIITSISFIIGFALIWEGKALIHLWVGPDFDSVYPVLAILAAGHMLAASLYPCISLLFALDRLKMLSLLAVFESLLNVILSIFFVRLWGIYGVAMGTLASIVLVKVVFLPLYTTRVLSIPYSRFLEFILKPMLATCLPGILLSLFARPERLSWPIFFVTGCMFVGGMCLWTNRFGLRREYRVHMDNGKLCLFRE